MKQLTIYTIISYILLPFGAFMGMTALICLLASLGHPEILFRIFLLASIPIYVFTSFHFFQNGIIRRQALKSSLKDWIKVNGFLVLFVSMYFLVEGIIILANPGILKEVLKSMDAIMDSLGAEVPNKKQWIKLTISVYYCFLFVIFLLFIHTLQTLRLIRRYQQIFSR